MYSQFFLPNKMRILIGMGIYLLCLAFACLLLFSTPERASSQSLETLERPPLVVVLAGHTDSQTPPLLLPQDYLENTPQTAVINVNYLGSWDPQAQAAFQYAVDIWETLVTSAVPIDVNAEWVALAGSVLGQAGPTSVSANFSGAPQSNTWYPSALANKLANTDLTPSDIDIEATFNSARSDWYFGTDGSTPFNRYDFVSVVLHEIGHGLGFLGSMNVGGSTCGSGNGCWGFGTLYPLIYDRFTENNSHQPLLSFPNYSPQLASQLTGGNTYFDGPLTNAANGGTPARLYAPSPWQAGSSYSHLNEATYPAGNPNALMSPILNNGEVVHSPGNITLGMFFDMGWAIDWPTPPPTPVNFDHCGTLSGNETWYANGVVHVLTCSVIVPVGISLTIEEGAIIKPQNGAVSLIVDGMLNAPGSSTNPIYITSYHDDTIGGDTNGNLGGTQPHAGDWDRVWFRDGSSGSLSYVRFRYGGDSGGDFAMLHTDAATVNVDHSTFFASHFCAISSHPSYEVSLADIAWTDFTSNVYNGQCIRSTSLVANAIWDETEVPYVLLDDVTIPVGFTLTWSPGIIIKPAHGATSIVVDGTLNASGTSGSPVYITSINDDATGGNTNNNANPPNPGDWDRVWFRNGSSGSLSYFNMRYGGDAGGDLAAIHINDASPNITNCVLKLNVRGVSSSGLSANPVIHSCIIADNTEYGVFNATSGHWIDARFNWWNNNSGPYDPSPPGTDGDFNQTGTGDRVNDYVLYRPWTLLEYVYLPLLIH